MKGETWRREQKGKETPNTMRRFTQKTRTRKQANGPKKKPTLYKKRETIQGVH